MKKGDFLMRSFLLVLASASFAFSQWTQDRFAIGAWWDPELTNNAANDEAALRRYVDANFNLLGGMGDRYSWSWNTPGGGVRNITNQYLLNRVAAVNNTIGNVALRASVHEDAFLAAPVNLNNYTGLTGAQANALHGYTVIHEPTAAELPAQLNAVQSIRTTNPNRVTFDVLASIWRVWNGANTFQQNWTAYDNYVTNYVNHASTRVATFDYYVLSEIGGATNYSTAGADRVNYYRTLDLFGQRTRTANKEFWGFANGNDRQIDWWNAGVHTQERFPYPTDANLRFNAYSNLTYGAKGILWYTYDIPTTNCNPAVITCETFNATASNDNTIYNRLTAINQEMRNMGPTLMRLNWQTTVHGSATDPFSGETELPTVNASTPVMANEDTHDQIAIGIHNHMDNGRNYLTFFNKDWQNASPGSLYFSVSGFHDVFQFDKTNSTWSRIPQVISWAGSKTAFGLNFQPADLQIVDVKTANINALHQYWNSSANSHYYVENYEGADNGHGWIHEEVIGGIYAATGAPAGTTPLYQYWNSALNDWYYTTTWGGMNNCCGWAYVRTIGRIYPTQQPGTIPLYQYWNSAVTDHYYTTRWQGVDNGYGWTVDAVVGYVIPNI